MRGGRAGVFFKRIARDHSIGAGGRLEMLARRGRPVLVRRPRDALGLFQLLGLFELLVVERAQVGSRVSLGIERGDGLRAK